MLPWVNFINIQRAAFASPNPKSAKNTGVGKTYCVLSNQIENVVQCVKLNFQFFSCKKHIPYVFLEFVFWQLWPVGCADLGCFLQTNLVGNLGSNFFRGPWYVVNPYCLLSDELKTNILYVLRAIDAYILIVQVHFYKPRLVEY